MGTGQAAIKLLRYSPGLFLLTILFRGADDLVPLLTGAVFKEFFDALTGDAQAGSNPWTYVALFIAIEIGDVIALFGSAVVWPRWWYRVESLLRKNLMTALLNVRTPRRISGASGEITNNFRDDVGAIVRYLERYIHLWGNLIFAVLAIITMVQINVMITLVTVIPSIFVVIIIDAARKYIHKISGSTTGRHCAVNKLHQRNVPSGVGNQGRNNGVKCHLALSPGLTMRGENRP